MRTTPLQLAMFDMAGTTVNDEVEGLPLMVLSMQRAFENQGIYLDPDGIHKHRGKDKLEAVRALLMENADSPPGTMDSIVQAVYRNFLDELENHLTHVSEIQGTTEVFEQLRSRGIAVGVGSGFPVKVVDTIVRQLGWLTRSVVDYVGSSEALGVGRPDPKMIHDAMQQLGVTDPQQVVKIGDTVADVQEGKNAGVWTIAVSTGSQTREQLMEAKPDYILASVREVVGVLV